MVSCPQGQDTGGPDKLGHPIYPAFANSVTPDQLDLKKTTDLDLHCLHFVCHLECELLSTTWIKKSDWLKIRSGCGILIYPA